MKLTRRNFLHTSGMTALTAAFLAPFERVFGQTLQADQYFPVPAESATNLLNYLKRTDFEPFLNTFFNLRPENQRAVRLQLLEVADLTRKANHQLNYLGDSFSLLFQDLKRTRLPQKTYEISHDALGSFSLLLVPVGLRGNRYEAVINRINI